MGISIRPDSWFLKWIENKQEKKSRIADYLDEIANEATDIAKIWDKVLTSLSKKGKLDSKSKSMLDRLIVKPEHCGTVNQLPISRLESFYRSVSSVLGSENKNDLEYVLLKISHVLQQRNITVRKIEKELLSLRNAKYFNDENKLESTMSITESINLMYKEASALHVFAKEYRAKN